MFPTLKWVLVTIFVCLVKPDSNFTTKRLAETFHKSNEYIGTTENSVSSVDTIKNVQLSVELKLATECKTPNNDPGYCVEIKQCPKLLNQVSNINAKAFLLASKCGPKNENIINPKVCCGRFDNFQEVKSDIDDDTVFPKKCGRQKLIIMHSRILGGTKAAIGEFPWMARLVHKNQHGYRSIGCSAFLIHTKYVLTAAHCVHKAYIEVRGPVFSVILGEYNTETKVDCNPTGTYCADPLQISRVAKVIVHPGYDVDSSGHYNDIAIIHMKKAARLTEFVQPICLQTDREAHISETYVISGWGKTETELFSKIKLKLELPAVNKSECIKKYSSLDIELLDSQICAGGEEGKDSCSGDSGGPLMVENGTNYLAAGVVSYGVGCGNKGWPGVYTYIPNFVSWIKHKIIVNSLVGTKNPKHNKKTSASIQSRN